MGSKATDFHAAKRTAEGPWAAVSSFRLSLSHTLYFSVSVLQKGAPGGGDDEDVVRDLRTVPDLSKCGRCVSGIQPERPAPFCIWGLCVVEISPAPRGRRRAREPLAETAGKAAQDQLGPSCWRGDQTGRRRVQEPGPRRGEWGRRARGGRRREGLCQASVPITSTTMEMHAGLGGAWAP